MSEIIYINNYSYGVCSAYIGVQWNRDGKAPLNVFSDTKREDKDTYRFGEEVAAKFGLRVVDASDGRDLWDVFRQWKMIPARQLAACSVTMKIIPSQAFLSGLDNQGIAGWVAYGYDCDEQDRSDRTIELWPFKNLRPCFPLQEWGVSKAQCFGFFAEQGIATPRVYQWLNNANCVPCKNWRENDWKACAYHMPEVFAEAREFEAETGLRWMQDGPLLKDLEIPDRKPDRKGRKKLAMAEPAFSFDMGCDRCAVD